MSSKKHQSGSAADIEKAYYDALSRADLDGLMALWADDEEIVCVHPGAPRLVGHAAIRASWEAIFERGPVYIKPVQMHAFHNLMTATHNVIEEVQRLDVPQTELHIISTNIYTKTPRGWRLAVHHASVAPGNPEIEQITTTLH